MKLGYLVFTLPNNHSCEVVLEPPEGVTVNLEKNTWRYAHAVHKQDEPIGHGCYLGHRRNGLVGVYDLDNLKHLSSMVRDAVDAHTDHSNAD